MGSSDSLRPGVVASFKTFGVAHHKNKDPDGRLRAHAADRHDRRSPLWPPLLDEVFAGWSITGPGWEGHQQVRSAEAISTSIDMRPASCTSARLRARHNPLFLTDSLTSQFFTDDYTTRSRDIPALYDQPDQTEDVQARQTEGAVRSSPNTPPKSCS